MTMAARGVTGLRTLVADIADLIQSGNKVIIISSGAIAFGARKLNLAKGGRANLAERAGRRLGRANCAQQPVV